MYCALAHMKKTTNGSPITSILCYSGLGRERGSRGFVSSGFIFSCEAERSLSRKACFYQSIFAYYSLNKIFSLGQ